MRTRNETGFTLVELMIVVAIIAIVAAIAIPNLLAARLSANESSTIASLRSIASAQGQFQIGSRVDVNHNGAGEYGLLRELSGAVGLRQDDVGASLGGSLVPPVLSGAFRHLDTNGEVSRSGYRYRIFLPASGGQAVGETASGSLGAALDLCAAEGHWCCYAWPAQVGASGRRTFVVTQHGDLCANSDAAYSGQGALSASNAGAAFRPPGPAGNITGMIAIGTTGRDGSFWASAR
jgi:prepilin-type N-terminal cleavage/methylation domain-containing protein